MPATTPAGSPSTGGIGLVVAGVAAALMLAWLSVGVNLKRACVTQDTPYLDLCAAPAGRGDAAVSALRSRITANPGDANAYVRLALTEGAESRDRALQAAAAVTPNEPNVLMLQARSALERQDWARAVPPLVQLVEHRDTREAAEVLARMIAAGGANLLIPHLAPETHWLGRVLVHVPPSSLSAALPMITAGWKLGVFDRARLVSYVQTLEAAGAWADAYSLWLALRGNGPQPVLYNAGFDDPFNGEGFDWEVGASGPPSRAGALVERRITERRGAVLEVRFTGKAMAIPVVRQHLFLGEGSYRLKGQYMARRLRTEQGLAWTTRCTASRKQAGISPPLMDTEGAWRTFSFDFSVPAGCGLVATLQLETHAPFEAAAGIHGQMAFDAFVLEKLAP